MNKSQRGSSVFKVFLVLILIGFIIGGGYYAYRVLKNNDSTTSNVTSTTQPGAPKNPDTAKIPEGFVEYINTEQGLSFAYPQSWGEAKMVPGPETPHLIAGSEYQIDFTLNKNITAGLMSVDRKHNPEVGHGGMLYAAAFVNLTVDELVSGDNALVQLKDDNGFIVSTPLQTLSCEGVGNVMVHNLGANPVYTKVAFLYIDEKADMNTAGSTMCDKDQYQKHLSDIHLKELKDIYQTIKNK